MGKVFAILGNVELEPYEYAKICYSSNIFYLHMSHRTANDHRTPDAFGLAEWRSRSLPILSYIRKVRSRHEEVQQLLGRQDLNPDIKDDRGRIQLEEREKKLCSSSTEGNY